MVDSGSGSGSGSSGEKREGERDDDIPTLSCCDYIEYEPEDGTMIIMPSYLQHAVLPLYIEKQDRGTVNGLRISMAFNFEQDSDVEV